MPGGSGQNKGRKTVHFSLVSPLDHYPDQKYKPYFHVKKLHDSVFVIDLDGGAKFA